ncbi:hypothetical protein [Streptomonospora wellingtoniae]|uniref:Uncharacterized protein n=1 Tax=Streptomonospora wellingtoniae TaxID=3075544 RepID=A0ABU2L0Y3_9ACTN|nr:hypothetical protein [Streptomonospora sp. DSM 45055]MDT0305219.1 hypothetical protein [Streptomonospora sp. DSM 45055]
MPPGSSPICASVEPRNRTLELVALRDRQDVAARRSGSARIVRTEPGFDRHP